MAIVNRNDIKNKVRENSNTQPNMKDMEITRITMETTNNSQIHIGNFYGKQETYNIDDTQREYDELTTQIMEKREQER